MRKMIAITFFLLVAVSAPSSGLTNLNPHYTPAVAAGGGMAAVSLIIKKLTAAMGSLNDLDELEKAGMSKSDVDRMRRAMKQKIGQMQKETIDLIYAL